MRIRAERDDLADVLARAARAVGNRSPLPILQGLLCEVSGDELRVTGTDTEITIRTTLKVEVLEEGKTVIPAKLAADAVKRLPSGAVAITASDGEVEITGNGPRFRLREMNVEDFPTLSISEGGDGFSVDSKSFIKALSQVGVAASTDEARPTLTGVLFEKTDDGLRLVATDSYRLAVCDLPGVDGPATALIPYRALRELGRSIADDEMQVMITDRDATFTSGRGSLTVRIIEATFPNYRQLIPDSYPARLVVDRASLVDAVSRASLVAEDHIPIRFHLRSGGAELSVSRQEVGEETEQIEGDYTGDEMTIAFNTRYLTDGVQAITTDNVVLDTSDPLKPGLMHGEGEENFRYLLMPVRL
ncbi:MAG: DNA polymerase III subunit beta [Actinobacteria bacterium]|nr:DNA polymerase III subunit beta [Actinomycetota bacterium]